MKSIITCLLMVIYLAAQAQVTAINPNQAYQGQSIQATITSSGLFLTGSSPQGNIQDIILKNATDSVFAISDSTNVVSTNTATSFWNIPSGLATGLYSLIVRVYNSLFSGPTTDYPLNNSFTVTASAATVSGTVFNDLNSNGILDAGELGLPGYTLRLNASGNSATSASNGTYTLGTVVGTDTVNLIQLLDDIYTHTTPTAIHLNVAYGANAGNNFGLVLDKYLTSISADSAVRGEHLTCTIHSRKVFKLDTLQSVTLSSGAYNINGTALTIVDSNTATATFTIPAVAVTGLYNLSVSVKSGLNSNTRSFVLDSAFTVTTPPTVSGTVFNDRNHNGVKDAGEPGMSGYKVQLGSSSYVYSDTGGHYTLNVLPGQDTIHVIQAADDIYAPTNSSSSVLTVGLVPVTGVNFGLALDRFLVSVSPASSAVGTTFSAVITDSLVTSNSTLLSVVLQNGGYSTYANSLSVPNAAHINASFNIPPYFASGKYNLVVTVKNVLNNLTRSFVLDTAVRLTGPIGLISGYTFADSNGNSLRDAGEPGQSGQLIEINGPVSYSATTNSNGAFSFPSLPNGNYTVTLYNPNYYYSGCGTTSTLYTTPTVFNVVINNDSAQNINFGFQRNSTTSNFDLFIHPGWRPAIPGFERHYWIFYGNLSNVPAAGGVITFQYDPSLIYDSSNRVPNNIDLINHTLTYNVDSIYPTPNFSQWYGGWNTLNIYMKVPVTDTAGQLLHSFFSLTPTVNDCSLWNNTLTDISPVTSSQDPNFKSSVPYGPVYSGEDSIITYTIEFQNTGTASTHFVILKDTLNANLDYRTVMMTGSSSPQVKLDNSHGILTFTLDPLILTDSATDVAHSIGFVSFMVKVKTGTPVGTTINNTAYVYFDYNNAVITNTATNEVSTPLSLQNLSKQMNVSVHPNPFEESTTISFSNPDRDKFTLTVYDLTGNIVKTMSGSETEFLISRDSLTSGVYIYKLINQRTKLSAKGKVSVL